MSADTDGIPMSEIVINELAFRSLNPSLYTPSENTTEALDLLSERIRQTGLAISIALMDIAQAIEKTKEPA